jgi:hypothetical protein
MKHLIITLLLIGGFVALTTAEANAVVCACGVYRAGCVGADGAAVVARPVVRPVARAAVGAAGDHQKAGQAPLPLRLPEQNRC